jgi:hypothetical protein
MEEYEVTLKWIKIVIQLIVSGESGVQQHDLIQATKSNSFVLSSQVNYTDRAAVPPGGPIFEGR